MKSELAEAKVGGQNTVYQLKKTDRFNARIKQGMAAYPSTYTGYECEDPKNPSQKKPVSRHLSLNYEKQPKISLKSELVEKRKTDLVAKNHASALQLIGKHTEEKTRVEAKEEGRRHYFQQELEKKLKSQTTNKVLADVQAQKMIL